MAILVLVLVLPLPLLDLSGQIICPRGKGGGRMRTDENILFRREGGGAISESGEDFFFVGVFSFFFL